MTSDIDISTKLYELFANIFVEEPTPEFLRLLQGAENEKLLKSFGVDCLSDVKHFSLERQAEVISVDYARLFLMPSRPAPLYESIHRGEDRLWGESSVKVSEIYKKFGFKLDEGFRDPPDHISAELSFLAKLSELESEYGASSLLDAKKGVSEVKKFFLENHLLKWFSGFRDGIIKCASLSYYREMVIFLDRFLREELEGLRYV